MLVHALVISRINYCNNLYVSLLLRLIQRLQQIQNGVTRLVLSGSRLDHISPVLARLQWLRILSQIKFKVLIFTYRVLHGQGHSPMPLDPPSWCSFWWQWWTRPAKNFLKTTRSQAFSVVAPSVWNCLPVELCLAPSLQDFKKQLKTHLFQEAFEARFPLSYARAHNSMSLYVAILLYAIFFSPFASDYEEPLREGSCMREEHSPTQWG